MTDYERFVEKCQDRKMRELQQRQMREEQLHRADMLDEARRQSRAMESQESSVQTLARWGLTGGILALYLAGHAVVWLNANWKMLVLPVGGVVAGIMAVKMVIRKVRGY